jgi:hypothetical protein
MGERSFVEPSRGYYEDIAKANGYGKPELRIDRTKLIPFFSIYLSSIAIVLSVVAIVLVIGGM